MPLMIDTFVEVIRKLDVERVQGLGIEINGLRLIDTLTLSAGGKGVVIITY